MLYTEVSNGDGSQQTLFYLLDFYSNFGEREYSSDICNNQLNTPSLNILRFNDVHSKFEYKEICRVPRGDKRFHFKRWYYDILSRSNY